MSKWAVAYDGDDVHVVPAGDSGGIAAPHDLKPECVCGARRDDREPRLIIHHDKERGGYDA